MTARDIVDKYLGKRYVSNGRDPNVGLDCWGLVMLITNDIHGVEIPDFEYDWREIVVTHNRIFDTVDLSSWVDKIELQRIRFGDYLLLETLEDLPIHVGVFMQDDKFIHAKIMLGVVVESIHTVRDQIAGVYRLRDDQSNR